MLKAGFDRRDISPREPLQLAGYPHVRRISTGVHDPLLATAAYLTDGNRQVVVLALDILLLSPPRAAAWRQEIAEHLQMERRDVFLSATHTHSGPVSSDFCGWRKPDLPGADEAYLTFVQQETLAAALGAKKAAQPAEAAWLTADAKGVGGNRLADDGPADPEVGLLAIREPRGGALFGLLSVYAMHPTVLHEDSTLVSSDFPHYAREVLRERWGDTLTVAYMQGTSGNQSPRRYVTGQTFAEAERLGRMLGERIAAALDALPDDRFQAEFVVGSAERMVKLPERNVPSLPEAEAHLKAAYATLEALRRDGSGHAAVRTAECSTFGAEAMVQQARAAAEGRLQEVLAAHNPIPLQVLRLGDVCLVGICGECFVEFGLELKRLSPVPLHVATLVNGSLQGYIVTPEAAAEGGYEASLSFFTPEAGSIIVAQALELVKQLIS